MRIELDENEALAVAEFAERWIAEDANIDAAGKSGELGLIIEAETAIHKLRAAWTRAAQA